MDDAQRPLTGSTTEALILIKFAPNIGEKNVWRACIFEGSFQFLFLQKYFTSVFVLWLFWSNKESFSNVSFLLMQMQEVSEIVHSIQMILQKHRWNGWFQIDIVCQSQLVVGMKSKQVCKIWWFQCTWAISNVMALILVPLLYEVKSLKIACKCVPLSKPNPIPIGFIWLRESPKGRKFLLVNLIDTHPQSLSHHTSHCWVLKLERNLAYLICSDLG